MATKPIPPKTAAKLDVALRCLLKMGEASESTDTFRRELANFLTSASSVTDVLINELAAGDRPTRRRISPLISKAMECDSEMEELIRARNADIHEGELDLRTDWVPERSPFSTGDPGLDDFFRRHRLRRLRTRPRQGSQLVGVPNRAEEQLPRAFFSAIADRDAFTVCTEHLDKVRRAAVECVQLYG